MSRAASLLLLSVIATTALAGTLTTDPRCAGYTCTLDRNTPAASFTSDPTTCSNATNCPRCLVGPEWEQRIAGLGANTPALRSFVPTILVNNWLSAEISDTVVAILLREVLGFTPRLAAVPVDGSMDIICCTEPVFEFEKWPSGRFPDDEGYFTVSSLPAGYEGGSGLFVPGYVVDRFPLATSYNAYTVLPDYATILPRGMSTDCRLLLKDPALGCVGGNYHCDDNTWTNTTCTDGRYVPPQCAADPTRCSEVFLAHPGWDQARFEALIRNTGLPFVAAYLGGSGLPAYVRAAAARRENIMFYWWQPDPLPSSVGAKIVNFPPNNYECEQANVRGGGDPTLSGFDCAYPRALLLKLGRRADMRRDASFKHFFDSFTLTSTDMATMLGAHSSAGGNGTAYGVSCDWVRGSFGTWQAWISPLPTEAPGALAADSSVLVPAIAAPLGACVAIAAAVAVALRVRALAATKHAPKKPPLALVFTDVESSTRLWEAYGSDMAAAMETHHDVIRRCIDQHQCYEVKTIGDAFMVACPTVLDATMLCFDIQTSLHAADWPDTLVDWKGVAKSDDADKADALTASMNAASLGASTGTFDANGISGLLQLNQPKDTGFRGLNVRMGIHHCVEVEPKFDVIHRRYDYYGHDVNMSARVQGAAQGGQILVTEETLSALQNDPDFESVLGADCVAKHVSRAFELKGVAEPVSMYSVLPATLAHRTFEKVANAPDDVDGMNASLKFASCSSASSMASGVQTAGASAVRSGVESVFAELEAEKPAVAESVIVTLCNRYNLAAKGSLARRTRMVVRAIVKTTDHETTASAHDSVAATPTPASAKYQTGFTVAVDNGGGGGAADASRPPQSP